MIEFSLPEDVAALEAELLRFAEREMRPRMRDFERERAWPPEVAKGLEGFALRRLDEEAGALAKAVALEAIAFGDAGGLLGYDRPGPAAAALTVSGADDPDVVLVMGERALIDCASRARRALVTAGDRLALFDVSECEVRAAHAGAFHASDPVSIDLARARSLGEWPVEGLVLRGRARLWPSAVLLGIARASFEYAVAYAKDRIVMGKPVAHHQGNAFAIAEAAGDLEAARLAVRAAANRFDAKQEHAGVWASLAYLDACDTAHSVTDLGVQLLGGHGYIEDHPVEKWYREARALSLLFGGRDGALEDLQDVIVETPDPVLG